MCKSTKPQDKSVDESSEVVLGAVGSRCEEHERNVSLFLKRSPGERHAEKCPHTLKRRMSPSGGDTDHLHFLISGRTFTCVIFLLSVSSPLL